MPIQAVVYKENTLGLLWEGNVIEPLQALITKGATFSVHLDPFHANQEEFRLATKEDFEEYKVYYSSCYQIAE